MSNTHVAVGKVGLILNKFKLITFCIRILNQENNYLLKQTNK